MIAQRAQEFTRGSRFEIAERAPEEEDYQMFRGTTARRGHCDAGYCSGCPDMPPGSRPARLEGARESDQTNPQREEPGELADGLVFARQGTTLVEKVHVIGARWTGEQWFEVGKGEVGLDQYEVVRRESRASNCSL